MTTLRYSLQVPLALIAGAAVASNPRWFPFENTEAPSAISTTLSPVEAVRAQEAAKYQPMPQGRLGAESPELRTLRSAEDQLFAQLEENGVEFEDAEDIRAFTSSSDFLDGLNEPNLPIARHDAVRRYVEFFSVSPQGREMFSTWLKRSGRYREIIARSLREQGLPSDLEALVFVESGFWPTAKSTAGAAGLWQFMPATARAYGLTVTATYDERRNPWRSSDAAAKHLNDLYTRFKSWDLALAAYNYGYQNVERRLSEAQVEDFWDIVDEEGVLPEETRRYVPKIHAIAVLLNNLDHYGFDTSNLDEAIRAAAFEVPPGTSLASLARAAGTSQASLTKLNPEFLGSIVPDLGAPALVHLPRTSLARARVMLPRLLGGEMRELSGEDSLFFDHGGDDVTQSRLEKTVVSRAEQKLQVADLNRDTSQQVATPVTPRLQVPESTSSETECVSEFPIQSHIDGEVSQSSASQVSMESALTMAFIRYRVSKGDSLSDLATRFKVSERELVFDNGIRNRQLIYRGQELKIRDAKATPDRQMLNYKVRPGDSLAKIARRHAETETQLAKTNNLQNPDHIRIGQLLLIPPG